MNDCRVREMTSKECIELAKKQIADAEKNIESAKRSIGLAEKRAAKVTGRPFMAGVNEPKDGQKCWVMNPDGVPNWYVFEKARTISYSRLNRGLVYPTETDCIEGEKRRVIRARYEGMGIVPQRKQWYFTAKWNYAEPFEPQIHCEYWMTNGGVYFETSEDCKAAIDTINREYGERAFERYVLEVEV